MAPKKRIALSGGFDPIHIGHVKMIKAAAQHGDVYVILNSDAWLVRKKGYNFMDFEQRAFIIENIVGVKKVISVNDDDGTVCDALEKLRPDMFGNGGDRYNHNTPEGAICQKYDIQMIWNLGGEKIESSSSLVENYKEKKKEALSTLNSSDNTKTKDYEWMKK